MFLRNGRLLADAYRAVARHVPRRMGWRPFCVAGLLAIGLAAGQADAADTWKTVTLPAARDVVLEGYAGSMLQRSLLRLTIPPFNASYIRSDISYEDVHCYYDYSGTNVGETLEVWSQDRPINRAQSEGLGGIAEDHRAVPKARRTFWRRYRPRQTRRHHQPADARAVGQLAHADRADDLLALSARRKHAPAWPRSSAISTSAPTMRSARRRASRNTSILSTATRALRPVISRRIEGLAMLYADTKDRRYLDVARKMAELFIDHFDGNRNGHWSGHLMSWRGVLFLYEVTGQRRYLDLCQAKWAIHIRDFASLGGAIGGVADGFFHDHCFHEDWLRWNLELWRLTGNVRYLDVVERLVHNSYGEEQAATGGFGGVCWEGTLGVGSSDGVIRDSVLDQPYCCDYTGPAGLVYYKAFLAAGNEHGIYVNFFDNFTSRVKAAGSDWQVAARNTQDWPRGLWTTEVRLCPPAEQSAASPIALFVRMPVWASGVKSVRVNDQECRHADGRRISPHRTRRFARATWFALFSTPACESRDRSCSRRFHLSPEKLPSCPRSRLCRARKLLYAIPVPGKGRTTLLATVDKSGKLGLLTGCRRQFCNHCHVAGRRANVALGPGVEGRAGRAIAAVAGD